ncbi:hypothetical protein AB9F39_39575, partial [Rhizobium leguminosarum]|uniref:hypothetical protein n=1 Tax=Rhizobium leguminosarum TaxID=384 RepID=UPI003F9C1E6E
GESCRLLHNSLDRNRFRDKIIKQFKVLYRRAIMQKSRGGIHSDILHQDVGPISKTGGIIYEP